MQLVFFAVEHEVRPLDASDIAAHGGSEVLLQRYVVVDVVKTQHHIVHPGPSRCHQRNEPCAVVGDAGLHAVGIGNGIKGCVLAIDIHYKSFWRKSGTRLCGQGHANEQHQDVDSESLFCHNG